MIHFTHNEFTDVSDCKTAEVETDSKEQAILTEFYDIDLRCFVSLHCIVSPFSTEVPIQLGYLKF